MGALAVLSAAGASAAVGDQFASEFPNGSELPCIGGVPAQTGLIGVTQRTTAQSISSRNGVVSGSISYTLTVDYKPNDSAATSYSGTASISHAFSVPSGTDSFEIPVKVNLSGSDGSAAALAGTQTAWLYLNSSGRTDIFLGSGEGTLACTAPDPGFVPAAPGAGGSGEGSSGSTGNPKLDAKLAKLDAKLADKLAKLEGKCADADGKEAVKCADKLLELQAKDAAKRDRLLAKYA